MTQPTNKILEPRTKPTQVRSIKRAQQIMDVTSLLLERVGFDDLTTILITKELGISVGSLYHYFPNKHAILRSIAENWLKDWDTALEEISQFTIEDMDFEAIIDKLSKTFLRVYRQQKGILPLVQAMTAVPELRDLDEQHDQLVIKCMSAIFVRMGSKETKSEVARIASIYLEVTHTMLVLVLAQRGEMAQKTLNDLNAIIQGLLEQHINP